MAAPIKLTNVRIAYPRLFTPDEKSGKCSCLIMIPQGTDAERAWDEGVRAAWREAAEKYSAAVFPQNPSPALLDVMLGIKRAGAVSSSGKVFSDAYKGYISFNATSKRPIPVIDKHGKRLSALDDSEVYSGQVAHVSLSLYPFKVPEKTGIGRLINSMMIVGGGDSINLSSGGAAFVSVEDEWASFIEKEEKTPSFYDPDPFVGAPF